MVAPSRERTSMRQREDLVSLYFFATTITVSNVAQGLIRMAMVMMIWSL